MKREYGLIEDDFDIIGIKFPDSMWITPWKTKNIKIKNLKTGDSVAITVKG